MYSWDNGVVQRQRDSETSSHYRAISGKSRLCERRSQCWPLLFEPHKTTRKALRFMHAQHRAALGTSPFYIFGFDKTDGTEILYVG